MGAGQVFTGPSCLPCCSANMEVMCGRFVAKADPAQLAEKMAAINEVMADTGPDFPNYNVAPTTPIAAVVCRHREPKDEPTRRVRLMRWGLIPPWATAGPDGQPTNNGPLLINARADTVTISPAFRSSATSKRCLIPMDGYYEWRVNAENSDKKLRKTPFFLSREDGRPLCVAGLWSVWKPAATAPPLLSCTMITTGAVGELAGIHDRMPLVVPEQDWDRWLDPDAPADTELLARSPEAHGIGLREVSTLVNSVRNNGPQLLEPAQPRPQQLTLL